MTIMQIISAFLVQMQSLFKVIEKMHRLRLVSIGRVKGEERNKPP